MADVTLWSALPPAIGLLLAAMADWKWFWIGAGLWIVAVIIKRVIGLSINAAVIGWLKHHLPYVRPSGFQYQGE